LSRAALAAEQLRGAETAIALLDRARPRNLAAERQRLSQAFAAGEAPRPDFRYSAKAELGEVRRNLAHLHAWLSAGDPEQQLLAERAEELELEAELAEQVGNPGFSQLAARRFPLGGPALAELSLQWLAASEHCANDASLLHATDDERDPDSLLSLLARRVGAERLPVRVELDPGLASFAAVADGVIRIRAGVRLSAAAARRIAVHEIDGHLLPRLLGKVLGGVFAAGSRRGSDDEEGRALLLEQRGGMLDAGRRSEIALRYLAVQSLRSGAEFWETVRAVQPYASSRLGAVELACRVHRGGGLGREGVYLSAYVRVSDALATRPELERLMERGRLAAAAAARLLSGSVELDDDRDVVGRLV